MNIHLLHAFFESISAQIGQSNQQMHKNRDLQGLSDMSENIFHDVTDSLWFFLKIKLTRSWMDDVR